MPPQQDNDFPLDQIASTPPPPAGGTPASIGGGVDPNPVVGGTTFTPQPAAASAPTTPSGLSQHSSVQNPVTPPIPSGEPSTPAPDSSAQVWHQDAQADANQLYGQPQTQTQTQTQTAAPQSDGLAQPDVADPTTNMNQDFAQAQNLTAPTVPQAAVEPPRPTLGDSVPPLDGAGLSPNVAPVASPTSPPPIEATPVSPEAPVSPQQPTTVPASNTLDLSQPIDTPAPAPADIGNPFNAPAETATTGGLPGAEQLPAAAAGMDAQPSPTDPALGGVDPLMADMGTVGPPPSNKKKMIFIILGAVIGVVLIIVLILVLTRSSGKKPAVNLNQPAQPTTQTTTTTSTPATPPPGYVTIQKQCYSFAIYQKNTIPTDEACSFANAAFGNAGTSKISVVTTTDSFKNLDEFVAKIKPTLTITTASNIKLDGSDAQQIIYKASDGITYSKVLVLISGKNYQQDGKTVTSAEITTTYQDDFSKGVTTNVLSTWRWK